MAVDTFLELDGIEGEAQQPNMPKRSMCWHGAGVLHKVNQN